LGWLEKASQPGKRRTPHEIAVEITNPRKAPKQGRLAISAGFCCIASRRMIPKSGHRFPAFAKPASAGEGRSDKIMRKQKRRIAMTPFFVQIKCELGKSYQVANELAESEIASEIYSTAGDYDLLVKFYVEAGTDIGHFVNEKVQCLAGIKDTHTIITFKAFKG
jgi:DNA-binding Lrp family transcriptional regulator